MKNDESKASSVMKRNLNVPSVLRRVFTSNLFQWFFFSTKELSAGFKVNYRRASAQVEMHEIHQDLKKSFTDFSFNSAGNCADNRLAKELFSISFSNQLETFVGENNGAKHNLCFWSKLFFYSFIEVEKLICGLWIWMNMNQLFINFLFNQFLPCCQRKHRRLSRI